MTEEKIKKVSSGTIEKKINNYWVCILPLKLDLPDKDGERDAGPAPVLRDLLRYEGKVHRAQPLVVQGGRAAAAAAAAAHTDDEAGLVYHEVGRHLRRLVKNVLVRTFRKNSGLEPRSDWGWRIVMDLERSLELCFNLAPFPQKLVKIKIKTSNSRFFKSF